MVKRGLLPHHVDAIVEQILPLVDEFTKEAFEDGYAHGRTTTLRDISQY